MAFAGGFEWWLHFAAWGGTLLLGLGLLILKPRDPVIRTWAIFLGLFGAWGLTVGVWLTTTDPRLASAANSSAAYSAIGGSFLLPYFAAIYPTRRWLGARPWRALILAVPAAILVALHVTDAGLWHDTTGPRPLYAFHGVPTLLGAVFAIGFVLQRAALPPGPNRWAVEYLALGLLSYSSIHATWDGIGGIGTPIANTGPFVNWLVSALALPVILAALVLLLRRRGGQPLATGVRILAGIIVVGVASGAVAGTLIQTGHPAAALRVGILLNSIVCGTFIAMATYAIVRYQFFGLDLRLKLAVRGSTMAAAFVGVFFVTSESAATFFGERSGSLYVGILAAGALVFAFSPLQRVAERFSERAMPGVSNTPEYHRYRSFELYRAALESAAQDGEITRKERDVLETLRSRLEIALADARSLERDVLKAYGVRATPAGA